MQRAEGVVIPARRCVNGGVVMPQLAAAVNVTVEVMIHAGEHDEGCADVAEGEQAAVEPISAAGARLTGVKELLPPPQVLICACRYSQDHSASAPRMIPYHNPNPMAMQCNHGGPPALLGRRAGLLFVVLGMIVCPESGREVVGAGRLSASKADTLCSEDPASVAEVWASRVRALSAPAGGSGWLASYTSVYARTEIRAT